MDDNNVIYTARLHWVLFVWPIVFAVIIACIGFKYELFRTGSYLLGIIVILWAVVMWLTYHFSSLMIKKKQVILCTGILVRQIIDIPMSKIESIDIRQSVLGSVLQYGSLVITGTGGTRQSVNYLAKPLTCRRYIEQMMHG